MVSEIYELTPELEKFVTRAWVRREDSYSIITGVESIKIKKYIRDDVVCYLITHPKQEPSSGFHLQSHHVTFGKKAGGIMGLRLKKKELTNVSRAIVFLHPHDSFPRGDRDYPLFLSSDSSVFDDDQTFWTISWSRTIQLALEPPFVTNCRNNQLLGYDNKEHCQHECVSNKTMRIFNKTIFTRSITSPENVTVLSSESLIANRSLELLVDGFISDCNDSCWGHNCLRINYMPLVTSTLKDNESIVFQIFDQNTLETRITFQAKLTFVEFLIYILSIVGFWFGVSCLDLFEWSAALTDIKKLRRTFFKQEMKRKMSRLPFDPSYLHRMNRRTTLRI